MREVGNIVATFCGHDHNNDYWGDYYGIRLSYGRKTGHGGYGPPRYMQRGARVLEFQMKDTAKDPAPLSRLEAGDIVMDTWIREENGKVHTQDEGSKINRVVKKWESQLLCCGMKKEEYAFLMSKGFDPTEAFSGMNKDQEML